VEGAAGAADFGSWHGTDYNMLTHNCCHFCSAFASRLGLATPPWLNALATAGTSCCKLHHCCCCCCCGGGGSGGGNGLSTSSGGGDQGGEAARRKG
jgi:hypothetical protein